MAKTQSFPKRMEEHRSAFIVLALVRSQREWTSFGTCHSIYGHKRKEFIHLLIHIMAEPPTWLLWIVLQEYACISVNQGDPSFCIRLLVIQFFICVSLYGHLPFFVFLLHWFCSQTHKKCILLILTSSLNGLWYLSFQYVCGSIYSLTILKILAGT